MISSCIYPGDVQPIRCLECLAIMAPLAGRCDHRTSASGGGPQAACQAGYPPRRRSTAPPLSECALGGRASAWPEPPSAVGPPAESVLEGCCGRVLRRPSSAVSANRGRNPLSTDGSISPISHHPPLRSSRVPPPSLRPYHDDGCFCLRCPCWCLDLCAWCVLVNRSPRRRRRGRSLHVPLGGAYDVFVGQPVGW